MRNMKTSSCETAFGNFRRARTGGGRREIRHREVSAEELRRAREKEKLRCRYPRRSITVASRRGLRRDRRTGRRRHCGESQ